MFVTTSSIITLSCRYSLPLLPHPASILLPFSTEVGPLCLMKFHFLCDLYYVLPIKYKRRVKSHLGLLPEVVQKKPHLVTLLYLAQFILRSQHKKTWKVKFSYWNIFSYMCFRLIKDLISFSPKMLFVSDNSKLI